MEDDKINPKTDEINLLTMKILNDRNQEEDMKLSQDKNHGP